MKKLFYKLRSSDLKENIFDFVKILISAVAGYALGFLVVDIKYFIISMMVIIVFCAIASVAFAKNYHHFDLIDTIKDEQKRGNWVEVVRLGFPLSRPLWLSGRLETRVEIGEIIKTAVCSVNGSIKILDRTFDATYILSSVLIDDLGWTRFSMGQTEKAVSSIKEGIDVAKENQHWDIAIKGCRHLCGISLDINDEQLFWNMRSEIEKMIVHIKDEKKKKEIDASLDYSLAKLCRKQLKFDEALLLANSAKEKYESLNDYERVIKVFHLLGSINKDSGNYVSAEIIYLQGMEKARTWQRKERLLSLIEAYFDLKKTMIEIDVDYSVSEFFDDKEKFNNLLHEANEITRSTNQEDTRKAIHEKYKRLVKLAKKSTSFISHKIRAYKKKKGKLIPSDNTWNNAKDSRM